MIIFNVANRDESAYYSCGYNTRAEALELLRKALEYDPRADVVAYERQTVEEQLRAELEQVKRERDALLKELRESVDGCEYFFACDSCGCEWIAEISEVKGVFAWRIAARMRCPNCDKLQVGRLQDKEGAYE